MEPFYRRLSSHVCVNFGSPPSETGVWLFCFRAFQQIYAVYDPKRDVGGYVFASFNKFMMCMILAGCTGGTVLPAAL